MTNSIQEIRNEIGSGKCVGTINEVEPFNASLVELSVQSFPLPHGEAYVMFARHRNAAPSFTPKELTLSFSKNLPDDIYPVTPDSHKVILTFADHSVPTAPVIYTQKSGYVDIKYNDEAGALSGKLTNVILTNQDDDDVAKEIRLDIDFEAKGDITRLRRGTPCAA